MNALAAADASQDAGCRRAPGPRHRPVRWRRSAAGQRRLDRLAFELLRCGRLERFAAAVRSGADPDGLDATPTGLLAYVIFRQCRGGLPGVSTDSAIGALLELGCDPSGAGPAAGLPLYLAAQLKQWDVFCRLLDAGADPNALPARVRSTVPALVMRGAPDPLALLMRLAARGADFSAGAGTGSLTGPEAALDPVHVEALAFMLDHGADACMRNALGETLGHLAIGSPQALRVLADHGADLDAPDPSGFTPLMMACRTAVPIESVDVLLQLPVDVNARTDRGQTALHVNAWGLGDPERVRRLARAGAALDARDRHGHSAAVLAAVAHRAEVFDALGEVGADLSDVTDPARALAHMRRFLWPAAGDVSIDPSCRFAAFALPRLDPRAMSQALRAEFADVFMRAGMRQELERVTQAGAAAGERLEVGAR